MDFFLPYSESPEQSDEVLRQIADNNNASIPKPRIQKLEYMHNSIMMSAEVGCKINPYYECPHDQAVAILMSLGAYAICTETRGVCQGEPIYVGTNSIKSITHFD